MDKGSVERRQRFEVLFDRHHAQIAAYARRRSADSMVEDVVEETFLVAWRSLDGIPAEPLPWLYGVARRVMFNQRRAAARAGRLRARLADERELEAVHRGFALSPVLEDALRALGEREREAVLLVAWEGLTPAQGAVAAGCSGAAFRVRLHRARARLVRALEQADGDGVPTVEGSEP